MISKDEFERSFDEAMELKNEGDFDAAVHRLEHLATFRSNGRRHPAVIGVLAGILLYELDDVRRAMPLLEESVSLSPNSIRASLALFHGRFQQKEYLKAMDEMERFVSAHPISEYNELIVDLVSELEEKVNGRSVPLDERDNLRIAVDRLNSIRELISD